MTAMIEPADRILLAHGGGGELMQQLVRDHVVAATGQIRHPLADRSVLMTDGARLPWIDSSLVMTTDSYVVTPIEFPGGDIGKLAVCGTVNDLAVMGAWPVALSLGLILEEGLRISTLDRVMQSIVLAAQAAEVAVVTGDTKVIERRGDDEPALIINTAGVGRPLGVTALDAANIQPGDCVLVNGPIAEHGLTVLSKRNGLEFSTPLTSDAAPLNHVIRRILESGARVRFLRDATRGGVAGVLADICDARGLSIEVAEGQVPIRAAARWAAEMLGLDPLIMANEGRFIAVVAPEDVEKALDVLRNDPLGRHAACMGVITDTQPPLVELVTQAGGRRLIQRPYGEEAPRIC